MVDNPAVTIPTPMKRGLKAKVSAAFPACLRRYNPYPDEKGTESPQRVGHPPRSTRVTIPTPMKRGLKALLCEACRYQPICYNPYPDEKGTERYAKLPCPVLFRTLQSLPR